MFQITILSSYVVSAVLFIGSRVGLARQSFERFAALAIAVAVFGVAAHTLLLAERIFRDAGFDLSVANIASLVGWEIALVATIGALWHAYRGLAAVLLIVAAALSMTTIPASQMPDIEPLGLPLKLHAMTSLLAYGFITVGTVLSIAALILDRRLRNARTGGLTELMPPLFAMERLIFAIAIVGFVGLLLSIATGLVFVENLFAQHLIHKTVLSLLAAVLFGALIVARAVAGWRGRAALYLFVGGFATLVLAYFGSRVVLEVLLQREWG